jgi:hypothetical protein
MESDRAAGFSVTKIVEKVVTASTWEQSSIQKEAL